VSHAWTCPQGHTWTAGAAGPLDATLACPVCGGAPAAAAAAPAAVPGYEILGELGRGGMGVVYQARDVKLHRLVALKFLTAGAHAGRELLVRFVREAEALARLQHSNIIQIYEVGESGVLPYLALEFAAGGSLSHKLAAAPLPPRQAAEWACTLARAVHHAHQHGVLHRDLKPGNVLLTEDGTPKISDFGLAKLEAAADAPAEDGLTSTGAVLGTPGYMAPEQAGGVSRQLTAAVDVYALGALLYAMLTGRPPFLADGSMETVMQVLTADPVPPRRLRPAVPRDLETICLHCLQKSPRRRYASADALADDLRRYLDGRPIKARPVGPGERLLKWARRRPALASLLAVSALAVLLGAAGVAWSYYLLEQKNAALTDALTRTEDQRKLNHGLLVASVDAVSDLGDLTDEKVAPLPGSEGVRRELLEARLAFFAPFLKIESDSTEMRQRKGRALLEVANIHQKLGRLRQAEGEYAEAVDLLTRAADDPAAGPEVRRDLARACVPFAGLLHRLHRDDEALSLSDRGVALLRALADEDPGSAEYRKALAAAVNDRATLLDEAGHRPEALDAYAEAIRLWGRVASEGPDADSGKLRLAECRANRGNLYRRAGDPKCAAEDVEAALTLLNEAGPGLSAEESYRDALAGARYSRGLARQAEDPPAALPDFEAAARLWDELQRDYPGVPRYRFYAAEAGSRAGRLYALAGRLTEAEAALCGADRLYTALAAEWGDSAEWAAARRDNLYHLGAAFREEGKFEGAERIFTELVQSSPDDPFDHDELGEVYRGRADRALLRYRVLAGLPPVGLTVVPNPLGMGIGYAGQQRAARDQAAEAASLYRRAFDHLTQAELHGRAVLNDDLRLGLARRRWASAGGRATAAAARGDHEQLASAADALAGVAGDWPSLFKPNDAAPNFRLAALDMGYCLLLVENDKAAPPALAGDYAARTLRLLRKAVEAGYRDAAALRASFDVQLLLDESRPDLRGPREEMKQLLKELDEKSKP
jgi:tetratricopeptide (TPR) repeat protein